MTRKEIRLIAEAIREVQQHTTWRGKVPGGISPKELDAANATLSFVADRLMNALAATNTRFDRAKFKAACREY